MQLENRLNRKEAKKCSESTKSVALLIHLNVLPEAAVFKLQC